MRGTATLLHSAAATASVPTAEAGLERRSEEMNIYYITAMLPHESAPHIMGII